MRLSVYFPLQYVPSEKGSTLKGINLILSFLKKKGSALKEMNLWNNME